MRRVPWPPCVTEEAERFVSLIGFIHPATFSEKRMRAARGALDIGGDLARWPALLLADRASDRCG